MTTDLDIGPCSILKSNADCGISPTDGCQQRWCGYIEHSRRKRNRQPATTFYDQYRDDLIEVLVSDDEQPWKMSIEHRHHRIDNYDDDEEYMTTIKNILLILLR